MDSTYLRTLPLLADSTLSELLPLLRNGAQQLLSQPDGLCSRAVKPHGNCSSTAPDGIVPRILRHFTKLHRPAQRDAEVPGCG